MGHGSGDAMQDALGKHHTVEVPEDRATRLKRQLDDSYRENGNLRRQVEAEHSYRRQAECSVEELKRELTKARAEELRLLRIIVNLTEPTNQ